MKSSRILILILVVLSVAGCGTGKRLSRERGFFEIQPSGSSEDGMRAFNSPGKTFTGHLNLLYEKKIKGSADSPIIIGDDMLAFKTTRHRFLALDQDSGDRILRIKKRRGFVLDPVIADSLLVLIKRAALGRIQVINLFTGKVLKERTLKEVRSGPIIILCLTFPGLETKWLSKTEGVVDMSAVADSDKTYFAAGNGLLKALRQEDGDAVWKTDCGSAIVSELSLGQNLYVGLADGRLIAIDEMNGEVIWEQSFGFQVHGGMAEYDGRIYFGATDRSVYCLSSIDGDIIWQYETEGIVTASPIVYGSAILVGSHDRHFYSLDRIDGTLIDRQELEGPVILAAAVDNNRIFVVCRNNRFYCFEGN
jgi:outer membrane protein assembly factor BamB